jgi:hypothetical protein
MAMWTLLGSVVKTFLLLRDVFGYLLPGAVALGSVVYVYGFSWATKSWPGGPDWLAVVAAVIGCYVAGHLLVAIGYIIYDAIDKLRAPQKPAALEAELLYYRYLYPDLFIERDRRGTINILRIGVSVALLADTWLLSPPLSYGALIVGLLLLYNGYTGRQHLGAIGAATVAAGRKAEKNKVPPFTRKKDE